MTASCSRYNKMEECIIISPEILRNNFPIIGWNSISKSGESMWNINSSREINASETWFTITSLGYVNDGLVLHFDGIRNTVDGYNSSALIWEDLSGNLKEGSLVNFDESPWKDKGLEFSNLSNGVFLGDQLMDIFKENNTIEMVVELRKPIGRRAGVLIGNHFTGTGVVNYELTAGNRYRICFMNSAVDIYTDANDIIFYYNINSISATYNTKQVITHFNNSKTLSADVSTLNFDIYDTSKFWVGRDSREGETVFLGVYYSLRIYNRVLSAEEIAYNYAIDTVRFGF